MSSTGIARFNSSHMGSCHLRLAQINPVCCIQIALGIITLIGAGLSVAAILSYLPPIAGYVGGGTSISSLIILAIGNCCGEKRISPILPRQTDDRIPGALQPAATTPTLANPAQKHTEIPFEPAYVTPSKLVIPNELYRIFLQYLNGKDLAVVSKVCRQWYHVASDNGLWERLCLNERICPPAGTLALPTSYQRLYSASQTWRRQLADLPAERQIPFPTQLMKDYSNSIWKIEDYFFVYSRAHEENHFEIWDVSCTGLICKTILSYSDYLADFQFKKIGDIAYFFGWSRDEVDRPHRPLCLSDIYVVRLDLKTLQPLPYMHFPQKHRAHEAFKPQFEITQNEAFIGQEDGKIVIWDLSCRKPCRSGYLNFDDQPHWTSKREANWQASFTKKNIITVYPFLGSSPKLPELQMEEGEYERLHAKLSEIFIICFKIGNA